MSSTSPPTVDGPLSYSSSTSSSSPLSTSHNDIHLPPHTANVILRRASQKSMASLNITTIPASTIPSGSSTSLNRRSLAAAYLRHATSSTSFSSSRNRSDSTGSIDPTPQDPDASVSVTISDLMAFLRFAETDAVSVASRRGLQGLTSKPSASSMTSGKSSRPNPSHRRSSQRRRTSQSPSAVSRRSRGPSFGSSVHQPNINGSGASLARTLSGKRQNQPGDASQDIRTRSRSRSRGHLEHYGPHVNRMAPSHEAYPVQQHVAKPNSSSQNG
ncbi:hypothetical protein BC829DRAFT_248412 [Chytridium lagenaria]|nr:hypothetical protein BC829DRAFT_248412 [Chytridium lagenaria]